MEYANFWEDFCKKKVREIGKRPMGKGPLRLPRKGGETESRARRPRTLKNLVLASMRAKGTS